MKSPTYSAKCYVCEKYWPGDELGRVLLPLTKPKYGYRVMRVICYTCFSALADSVQAVAPNKMPVLHGF